MRLFIALLCYLTIVVAEDPCKDNGDCDPLNGLCWKTSNTTHYCACKAGFRKSAKKDKHECIDINECFEADSCDANSLCENSQGSYTCRCRCGYVKDYTGRHCLDASRITGMCIVPAKCYHEFLWLRTWFWDIPFKTKYGKQRYLPDLESGDVVQVTPTVKTEGICTCEDGFSLNACGYCEDINECEILKNPCSTKGGFCVNTEGSYYCDCEPGYVLGPCKEKCYKLDKKVPLLCNEPYFGRLSSNDNRKEAPPVLKTFNQPFKFSTKCSEQEKVGNTTDEQYDIDSNGVNDLRLAWTCVSKEEHDTKRVLTLYSEEEAKWTAWSCWTVCKATCWGGVQTRVRKCLHGRPGLKGCEGEGTQNRECYKGPKCQFRVRKDIRRLTHDEQSDLWQAMIQYKKDTTAKGFHSTAAIHGWPFQCDGKSCCQHGAKVNFLSWHRLYMLSVEEGLSRYMKNKRLGIPYWNWLTEDGLPPDFIWNSTINKKLNPFANMTVFTDSNGAVQTVQRHETPFDIALEYARDVWKSMTRNLMKPHLIQEFSESLENSHGGIHLAVCDGSSKKCSISLANLKFASFDPLFMFHHSQTDRLWAVAQKSMKDLGTTTWSEQTALEVFEKEAAFGKIMEPFGNKSLSGHKIMHSVNTIRDSYYYKHLMGVVYDDLENDGYGRGEAQAVEEKALRVADDERLFVGQYFQNVKKNVYINYYRVESDQPCNNLTNKSWIGSTLLLGTDADYRYPIPNLVPTDKTDLMRGNTVIVKACYTYDESCKELCPEATSIRLSTMPDPHLVQYVQNQPVDIYKFNWSPGWKLPKWQINVDGSSHWFQFYGTRAENIVQVPDATDWLTCNIKRGRSFDCSVHNRTVCVLPVGIYYLIDGDKQNCQMGLRMIVASRK